MRYQFSLNTESCNKFAKILALYMTLAIKSEGSLVAVSFYSIVGSGLHLLFP